MPSECPMSSSTTRRSTRARRSSSCRTRRSGLRSTSTSSARSTRHSAQSRRCSRLDHGVLVFTVNSLARTPEATAAALSIGKGAQLNLALEPRARARGHPHSRWRRNGARSDQGRHGLRPGSTGRGLLGVGHPGPRPLRAGPPRLAPDRLLPSHRDREDEPPDLPTRDVLHHLCQLIERRSFCELTEKSKPR